MKSLTCSGHDVATFLSSVDEARAGGLNPTLAVVFSSTVVNLQEIRLGLAERKMEVVGVSTCGEIANAELSEKSCVALLMEADRAFFEVRLWSVHGDTTMFDLGCELGHFAAGRFANPVVLAFAAGLRINLEPLVPGVHEGAGRAIPLFGGVAGDDLAMLQSHVFSGTEATDAGIIGLVLDGSRFQVGSVVSNGWQPVGTAKTITRAEGNVVYTIDNKPAEQVYRRYLEIEVEQPRDAPGVQYPLRVQRENGTWVLRPPLFYQDDQSILFSGSVPQGAKVTFCIPPSIDIVERVLSEAKSLHERVPIADAMILVHCIARQMALGPLANQEIQGLHNLWGAPMAGFFSLGEIGGSEPRYCDFHTESATLIVLHEING